jgi:peptidoglycan/LPS O-acetylase OafA/YrhL
MGIALYSFCWPTMTVHNQTADNALALISAHQWRFFLFFVLGTFVKQHYDKVQQWLDNKWLLAVCIVFFILVNAFRDVLPVKTVIMKGMLALTGLVIMFTFFRNKQAVFSQETKLGRTMQYVGRRTLDIYLIHFFLIRFFNITPARNFVIIVFLTLPVSLFLTEEVENPIYKMVKRHIK